MSRHGQIGIELGNIVDMSNDDDPSPYGTVVLWCDHGGNFRTNVYRRWHAWNTADAIGADVKKLFRSKHFRTNGYRRGHAWNTADDMVADVEKLIGSKKPRSSGTNGNGMPSGAEQTHKGT